MKKNLSLILLFSVAFFGITGCQPQQKKQDQGFPQAPHMKTTDQMMVNIYYLAGKLGMNITSVSDEKISLNDNLNTVVIYPKQNTVFLNEAFICPLGQTKKSEDMILVRLSLIDDIRNKLTKAPEKQMVIPPPAPKPVPPLIKPQPKKPPIVSGKTIVIDAGHGGKDPGSISYFGYYEKMINLDVAEKLADVLREKGNKVIMTRDDDQFIELDERARIANRANAALFVSIHCNSSPKSGKNGFTVYTCRQYSEASNSLAEAIDDRLSRTSISSNGIMRADFRVLTNTDCPAVLVEIGYISNHWEAKQLRNQELQRKLAEGIADGIANYYASK